MTITENVLRTDTGSISLLLEEEWGAIPFPVSHHAGNHCSRNMDMKPVLSPASKNHLLSF